MKPESRPSETPKPSLAPMSDEEAMAQVVEPAKEIVRVAALQGITGGFSFESCNDQGSRRIAASRRWASRCRKTWIPRSISKQIAKTMVASGWTDGPPPGKKPFGTVIHKGAIMAIMAQDATYREEGYVQVSGECRNMVDHRNDRKTIAVDITDQLR